MGGSSAADIHHHVKIYYRVFAALAVLTVVTVGVARIHLPLTGAIAVALFVASIKAGLVAAYFMHLISEKSALFWILANCALFFIVLLAVPALTESETVGRAKNVAQSPAIIHHETAKSPH